MTKSRTANHPWRRWKPRRQCLGCGADRLGVQDGMMDSRAARFCRACVLAYYRRRRPLVAERKRAGIL